MRHSILSRSSRADEIGELLDDIGVFGVAAEGDERHPHVMADEEEHGLARVAGDLQARQCAFGHALALEGVVVVAPLADVVQEQGQHQQLRRRQPREHTAKALPARLDIAGEPFQVADGQQRVLVDGVPVVEVAHHPPRDRLELGEDAAEQAAVVHLAEPVVQPADRLEERHQRGPVIRLREEVVGAVAVHMLLDARQRFLRHAGVVLHGRLERRHPRGRVPSRLNRIHEADPVA